MKGANAMSCGPGWLGEPDHVLYVLGTVKADRDEEGNFLIYGEPLFTGLDGGMLVPSSTEYSVDGNRANLAALLSSTSYGCRIIVIA
jgi:hypothetical protein